jgi:hypothetical protein
VKRVSSRSYTEASVSAAAVGDAMRAAVACSARQYGLQHGGKAKQHSRRSIYRASDKVQDSNSLLLVTR